MKVAVIYNKKTVEPSDVIDIFGPQTKERYNPKTVERVAAALEKGGHNVKVIEGNISVADELRSFMPRVMAGERPGLAFNMAYGIQGQSRYTHIPAMLEMLGVPYVGSGPEAHAVALDKVMTKIILQQNGLPTPRFWFFSSPDADMDNVVYPVIVKPKMEAVSMGMKVVDNLNDLRDGVRYIIETYQQQALVERFVSGREFAVGLLGNGPDLEVFPVVEFNLPDPDAIQTHEGKLKQPIGKTCPADIPQDLSKQMMQLARDAFRVLDVCDFARIDLRMDNEGHIYILELNSMASLGLTGSYVHAARTAGYSYESLVNRMLDVAAVRYFGRGEAVEYGEKLRPAGKKQPLRVRLRSHIRSHLTTMAENVEKMARINTYVHNTEGVNELGDWLSSRLKRFGFSRRSYAQVEVGNILLFANHDEKENDILLIGHLDTVYAYQDTVPFREEKGRFYGSGVAESKGGLAVLLASLQALRFTRRLRQIRCGILLISDDCLGGRYSMKIVTELSGLSKYVVGLKYGGKSGGIVTSCGGRTDYMVEMSNTKDRSGKASRNIIGAISQKIVTWQRLSSSETGIVVSPSAITARTSYGVAPDYANAVLDVHYQTDSQGEEIDKEIRRIARRGHGTEQQVRIRRGIHRPPLVKRDVSQRFFERVQGIADRLEVRASPIHRTTSSAVCYAPADVPVLEGLGPAGGNSRTPNEYILRDSLIDRATLLALLIRESMKEQHE